MCAHVCLERVPPGRAAGPGSVLYGDRDTGGCRLYPGTQLGLHFVM